MNQTIRKDKFPLNGKDMYLSIHSSTTYSSQDMKATHSLGIEMIC